MAVNQRPGVTNPAGQVIVERPYPFTAAYWFSRVNTPCNAWAQSAAIYRLNAVRIALAAEGHALSAQSVQQLINDMNQYCSSLSAYQPYYQPFSYGYPYGYGFGYPVFLGGFGGFRGGFGGGGFHGGHSSGGHR